MSSYAQSGVDLDNAGRTKRMIEEAVRSTHSPAVLAGMGAFGGALDLSAAVAGGTAPVLVASTDGVGTKTLIARALDRFDTVGQDLVNHCVNDVLVQGARPLFFMDYIASAHLDAEEIAEIVTGVALACRDAGCALLGGETAEMPGVYRPDTFDLAGTMVGVVERDRLITGSTIVPGDAIIGLRSTGLHTNGYSLARRVCEPLGYATQPPELGGASLGDALLAVHRSYLGDVQTLWNGGVTIKGMAHITGGGLIENVPRSLPAGTAARIHRGNWPVPPIFTFLLEKGEVADDEAYRVFNMGVGMVLFVAATEVEQVQALLPEADMIGEVVAGHGVELA